MTGLADYIIASVDEYHAELEQDILRKESDEIREFITECKQIAQDNTASSGEVFHLLKGCRLRDLETFEYAFELDEIVTAWEMNIYDTAILILVCGLERRCPNGVGISHVAQFTDAEPETVLEFAGSFSRLSRMKLITNTKGKAPLSKSNFKITRN